MTSPTVSIIIPTYNYGAFVGKAIESALNQSYEDLEVIVVDDGSKDDTAERVRAFADKRVRYIYQENRGLPGARNTGIRASRGEFLAFLDADDQYHEEKLARQVAILQAHPVVGLTYCDRLYVDGEDKALRWRQAPRMVSLTDLVTGYPFTPSDVVMRREWAFDVGLFDESFRANSEDLDFHLRLQLKGCLFARTPSALGYRQILSDRRFNNIEHKLETYLRALNTLFDDERCPEDVLTLRERAYADHYLNWGVQAAAQGETDLGRRFISKALALQPTLLHDGAAAVRRHLEHAAVRDGSDAADKIPPVLAAMPAELQALVADEEALIGAAYLRSGLCDIVWDRPQRGRQRVQYAAAHQVAAREELVTFVVHQLTGHITVHGKAETQEVCAQLTDALHSVGYFKACDRIIGGFQVNEVFRYYDAEDYRMAASHAAAAVRCNPTYLADRGILAVTLRALWNEFKL